MNFRRRKTLRWFEPKLVIFGMTVANFVLLWYTALRMGGVACVVCPWFYPWTYFNAPTLLLIAGVSILFSRFWSFLIGLGLSGYLLGDLFYRFIVYDLGVVDLARFSPYEEIVYAWQIQYLLGLVVFVEATVYLVSAVFSASNQTVCNNAS
jgi:hypothetical protein